MSTRRIPYRKFAQAVRRFDVSRVLDMITSTSAELQRADFGLASRRWSETGPVRQFTLAAVARVAIVEAGRRRGRVVDRPLTDNELFALCVMAIELDHCDVPETGILSDPGLTRMFARIMYQQALFQYSDFENIARTIGLLIDVDPAVRGIPTDADWCAALGATLSEFMTIVFQLTSLTNTYGGHLTPSHIHEAHQMGFFAGLDLDTVRSVIERNLAADLPSLQSVARTHEQAEAKNWSYNPLLGNPLVKDGKGGYLLPVYNYLVQKITPLGLFYTGMEHFGEDFSRALGDSFERYAGRHLAFLESAGAVVYPEVAYNRGQNKTIDYFLVFDEVVVLIETKGFRPKDDARAGTESGLSNLVAKVQHARNQIDRTAALIGEAPELAHIPADREIRGLVVTLEPVHNIDTFLYRDMFSANEVESSTISAHDIERICPILAAEPGAGRKVLEALTFADPTPPALDRAVKGLPSRRNPISTALWDSWKRVVPRKPTPAPDYYRRAQREEAAHEP
ncbi:hypothetical protein ACFWPK_28075 [Nocardia sp. NPDC058519]|uniref:hypothetical protein n=1 Tax=Nocardia sp. NPDC058519 TaxID=3346535 RepID=UPI0036561D08